MIRKTLRARPMLAAALSLVVVACGGGGGSAGNPGSGSNQPPSSGGSNPPPSTGGNPPPTSGGGTTTQTQQGRFVDSPVAGLDYRTAKHQGLTGALGEFSYEPGESIQFLIGANALGVPVPAAAILTPVEITGGSRGKAFSDAAGNLAWLLQSLDSDCNASNGLQISGAARNVGLSTVLDFTQPASVFTAPNGVAAQLIAQSAPACRQSHAMTVDEARSNLQASLSQLAAAPASACVAGQWCIGSSKATISPTKVEVDGQDEARAVGTVKQYFHLGGFGFGPFEDTKLIESVIPAFDQRACAPGSSDTCLSNPPAKRAYHCVNTFQPGFSGDCDESQRQRTWLRAFYLSQAGGEQVLFITIDAIGAGNIIMDGMKKAASDATGVPIDSVLTGATHSHAGADLQGLWGGVPSDWIRDHLYAAAAQAALQAKNNARAATLTYATGQEPNFSNYRRPRVDPTANTDKTLSVLQAKDSNGTVLGTLVQYAAHPTAIGESSGGAFGRAVYPDFPLGVEDEIEGQTGATAVYYNGPIADASANGPANGNDPYERTHNRGQCLARSALTALNPAAPQTCQGAGLVAAQTRRVDLAPQLQVHHTTAILPVTNPLFEVVGMSGSLSKFYDFNPEPLSSIPVLGPTLASQQTNLPETTPTARTTVSRLTLGGAANGLEIVTIPGEATNTFGQYIRGLASTPNMMLLGLTHNSFGYILPEEEFNFIDPSGDAGFVLPFTGYEEFVSLGPLTAPLLRLQAYNPLFNVPATDPRNAPPSVTACETNSQSRACALQREIENIDYIQRSYAAQCNDNVVANAPADQKEQAREFCAMINPETPLASMCSQAGLGPATCDIFGTSTPTGRPVR